MAENRHLTEEEVERYSLGESVEPELASVEEHLLVCAACRERVEASEVYVRSMRRAAAAERRPRARAAGWTFALAFAAVLLLGVLLIRRNSPAPVAVTLVATRGAAIAAQAPAGVPLTLRPDLAGLPPAASYSLEMVDRSGKRVWSGTFPGAPAASAPAGTYFVRLYSPSGTLLREYGLEVLPRR